MFMAAFVKPLLHSTIMADIKALENEHQTILDSVRAMIWYKDRENRILRCNKAAAQSLGLKVEEVQGRRTEDLYPEEAGAYFKSDLEVIETGKPKLGLVEPLLHFDGSKRWVQTDKIPYRDSQGEIIGVIVFSMDITERRKAEARRLSRSSSPTCRTSSARPWPRSRASPRRCAAAASRTVKTALAS
jgi:PAS domain S-box-containing protein